VDDPTECKVAYLAVVSHPAGETVAHLIDKFLQRRFAATSVVCVVSVQASLWVRRRQAG